ncbi:MAG: hypothetical protein OXF88_09905 [Rhodobacteraceae bacterium]|nr:hypothetical protein [Paracoccaceae bacterium]MCY4140151.1 hypothetical protein [Paracoccaceae bacterium]
MESGTFPDALNAALAGAASDVFMVRAATFNRLIRDSKIYWNYFYFSCQLEEVLDAESRKALLSTVAVHAPVGEIWHPWPGPTSTCSANATSPKTS